ESDVSVTLSAPARKHEAKQDWIFVHRPKIAGILGGSRASQGRRERVIDAGPSAPPSAPRGITSTLATATLHLHRALLLGVAGVGALRLPSPPTAQSAHAWLCTGESDRTLSDLARSRLSLHSVYRPAETDRVSPTRSELAAGDLGRPRRRSNELRRIRRPVWDA